MPTVLFVLFIVLVVVMLVGHALWLLVVAFLRTVGVLPSRPPAKWPQNDVRQQEERNDERGFAATVDRLWRLGHLSDAEHQRLIRLGTGVYAARPVSGAGAASAAAKPVSSPGEHAVSHPGPSAPAAPGRPLDETSPQTQQQLDASSQVPALQASRASQRKQLVQTPAAAELHPLDRPDSLEPAAPASPPLQQRSRQAIGDVIAAFLNKHNIRWGELIAGLLIVVCSIGLVVSLWNTLQQTHRTIPVLILMAGTAAIEGAGLYTLRRWRLRGTSRSVLVIASLLVPLNVVAGISLAAPEGVLLASPDFISIAVMVISAGVYCGLMWLAGRELLGPGAWRWVVAIIAPSITLLFVPLAAHSLGSVAALVLVVPVVAVVVSLAGPRLSFRSFATPGQLWRFLLHWGIALFAMAVAMAFTIAQVGLSPILFAWLTIAGVPLFVLAAADADRLRLHRAAARRTSIAITGRAALLLCVLILIASFLFAWPAPATALAWAATIAAASVILVARQQTALAKHAVFAAIAVAALSGAAQLVEPQPWLGWVTLEARLLTPLSVAVLGGLVGLFAAIAIVLKERPVRAADRGGAGALVVALASGSPALLWMAGSAGLWILLTSAVLLRSGPELPQAWLMALLAVLAVQAIALIAVSAWRPRVFHVAGVLIVVGWLVADRGDLAWLDVVEGDINTFASRWALQVLASIAFAAGALRLLLPGRAYRRASAQWLVGLTGVLLALSIFWIPAALARSALLMLIAAVTLYATGRTDRIASLVEFSFAVGFAALLVFAQDRMWIDIADLASWRSGEILWAVSVAVGGYALLWWLLGAVEERVWRRRSPASDPAALHLASRISWTLVPVGVAWIFIAGTPHAAWIFSEGRLGLSSIVGRPQLLLVAAASASSLAVTVAERLAAARPVREPLWGNARSAWLLPSSGVLLAGCAAAAMVVARAWLVQLAAVAVVFPVALAAVVAADLLPASRRSERAWIMGFSRIAIFAAALVSGAALAVVATAGVLVPFLAGRIVLVPFLASVALLGGLILLCILSEAVHGWSRFRYATRGLTVALVALLNFGYRIQFEGALPVDAVLLELAASSVVACWLLLVVESLAGMIPRRAAAQGSDDASRTGTPLWQVSPAFPPALLGLPWRPAWNRRGSLWTAMVAMSIAISLAATGYLFAGVFASARLSSHFSSIAIVASVAVTLLTLWLVLVLVRWAEPEVEPEPQQERWLALLHVARHPWTPGSLLLVAGPLAMWLAEAVGGFADIGWWTWNSMLLGGTWLAAASVILPHAFQSRECIRGQERFAWVFVGLVIAAATAGVVASLSSTTTVLSLASAVVVSFLLAYLRPDVSAAAKQAAVGAAVSVWATFLLWSEFDLSGGVGFPRALCQLGFLAACCVAIHAALWRTRVLLLRSEEVSLGLRIDAAFAVISTGFGLAALGLLAAADGPGAGLWFEGPLVGAAWLFAACVTVLAASSLLRCEIPGQMGTSILGLGAILGSVGYQACERYGNFGPPVALSAASLMVGVFALLLMWEFDRLVGLRRFVPALRDEGLAAARRQASREAALITASGAGAVALATFSSVLAVGDQATGWLWISALFAWAVAVAVRAGAERVRGLRTYSVLLLLAGVYAAALMNLPVLTDARLLAIAIRVLVSSVAMLPAILLLVPRVLVLSGRWTPALTRGAIVVAALLMTSAVAMLGLEVTVREAAGIPSMPSSWVLISAFALGAVAASLLGIAMRGEVPGVDPLQLSVRDRQNLVYAAQGVGLAAWWHVYLCRPGWAMLGLQDVWPWICVAIAFVVTGLAHLASRRGAEVIAGPLRTNALIIPVAGIWMSAAEVQRALPVESLPQASLLAIITVHYLVLAALDRRRRLPQALGIIAGNAAVWVWLASTPGWGFLQHPQLWIIPPAACVLLAVHLERQRLPAEAVTTLRYSLTLIIYISSTADMLIQQVGSSLAGPMVLATLALLGMALGIALRIRPFLYLGAAFVFVALLSMVWHAQVAIDQVWPWWAFGISMGVSLLAVLMLLERNRPAAKRLASRLRAWDG